jgi:2-polyprenyl-3-methyl-5-hydroxy-6-metoxy-1,4-benzoquinol methylase
MSIAAVNRLPNSHIESLQNIEQGYWWYRGRIHWATELVRAWSEENHTEKICYADLGCGTGGFGSSLSAAFPMEKVLLVDGDPALLAMAQKRPGLETLEMNLESSIQLPWQPNLISCMDVIEHLADDAGFVKRAAAQLPVGGALVISVPAFQFLFSDWDRQLGHHRRYTAGALKKLVEGAGLKIHTLKYMWSFLMPVAPYRKLRSSKRGTEFEAVPAWINQWMVRFSEWEWKATQVIPIPWGTSVITLAVKQ